MSKHAVRKRTSNNQAKQISAMRLICRGMLSAPFLLIGTIFLVVVSALGEASLPWIAARILNNTVQNSAKANAAPVGIILLVAAFLLASIVKHLANWFTMRWSLNSTVSLNLALMEICFRPTQAWIDWIGASNLAIQIDSAATGFQNLCRVTIGALLPAAIIMISLPAVLFGSSPIMMFASYLLIIAYLLGSFYVNLFYVQPISRQSGQKSLIIGRSLLDKVSGFITILLSNTRDVEVKSFEGVVREWKLAASKTLLRFNLASAFQNAILVLMLTIWLYSTAYQAVNGYKSPGDLIIVLLSVIIIGNNSRTFVVLLRQTYSGFESVDMIAQTISNAPASADGADGAEGERGRGLAPGDLVFEGVRFCYEDGRIGVDGFDATVARGSNVSIVGRTGSGKSTVSKLLLRFHEVDEGRILIGDVDIRSVPTRWLREHVYVVPQKPDLFTRTIWENIAYGSEGVGNDQICLAATAVQADAFIRQLPQGYDTVLAEGGGDLSGGERQRIAIARALLRRPSVLVLDEATSALDNATEQVVLSELRKWLPSTTIITIAHRLTAVTNSDKILVMSNGRVVEAGPPAALSAQDGFYSQLLKSQDENTILHTNPNNSHAT